MTYAAAQATWGKGSYIIADLKIDKALFLSTLQGKVQYQLLQESAEFKIISKDEQNTLHARGQIRRLQSANLAETIAVEHLQSIASSIHPHQEFYKKLQNVGYDYGKKFQGVLAQ